MASDARRRRPGRAARLATLVFAPMLAAMLGGCEWQAGAAIDPGDRAQVARGAGIYRDHCAQCHGAELQGQSDWRRRRPDGRLPAPPHDASGHTWHHDDRLLFDITREGMQPPWAPQGYQSDMPAFKGRLSDDDIRAVLAFIQSTWPEEVRARRQQMLAQQSRR